ncbi:MAG: elongation factor Ts [Clostridia bacterium]|nr:elongation factor Ts [Clostridia bacterium]
MAFTAKDVQALREKTGCGMMDCKKALVECDGDMDKAVDYLREKGLASQQKKAGRIAAEGTVYTCVKNGVGAVVEINAETDFVAGSDAFKELAAKIAGVVIDQNPADLDALLECKEDGKTVSEMVQDLFLVVRENIKVRRFARYEGVVSTYIHGGGRIGVMVKFDTTDEIANSAEFQAAAKDVAMQVAAANPLFLNKESVDPEVVEHEKKILTEQVINEGKPAQIAEKIVMGKMAKYYKENCLVDQIFVKDNDLTVQKYIDGVAKQLGGTVAIVGFERFEKGEGLQKREDNFADEVASMVK